MDISVKIVQKKVIFAKSISGLKNFKGSVFYFSMLKFMLLVSEILLCPRIISC